MLWPLIAALHRHPAKTKQRADCLPYVTIVLVACDRGAGAILSPNQNPVSMPRALPIYAIAGAPVEKSLSCAIKYSVKVNPIVR
jgi:hypothetical protein